MQDSKCLARLCDYLNIDYFIGKENYWEKTYHTLFGNASARVHLYSKGENSYNKESSEIIHKTKLDRGNIVGEWRKIYYKDPDSHITDYCTNQIQNDKKIPLIQEALLANNILNDNVTTKDKAFIRIIKYKPFVLLLRKIKSEIDNQYNYLTKVKCFPKAFCRRT